MRALVLTAAAGLLPALILSCEERSVCDPFKCLGCCASDDTCVEPATDDRCGAWGNSCLRCGSTRSCRSGQCIPRSTLDAGSSDAGPDGGTADGGTTDGGTTDGGAVDGGAADGGAVDGGTADGGTADGGTADGGTVDGGTADGGTADGGAVDGGKVGELCAGAGDCLGVPDGICKQSTSSGSGPYPNGYCTKKCGTVSTGGCPAGSICVSFPFEWGEEDYLCLAGCPNPGTIPGGCRPGYGCLFVGTVGGCWMSPAPKLDGGAPKTGEPCSSESDCKPPSIGTCTQELDGGTPTGYPGGHCTARCEDSPARCGDQGVCLVTEKDGGVITQAHCFRRCENPLQGRGDPQDGGCRTGYVCRPVLGPDGGNDSYGFCGADCNFPGAGCTWGACADSGYCQ